MPTFFIEADPTNTYLESAIDILQGVILDETTQTGGGTRILFDDNISLTYVHVLEATRFLDDSCYGSVIWSPAQALGTVQLDLVFLLDVFTEVARFSATNAGGSTTTLSVWNVGDLVLPAGSLVRMELRRISGTGTITYGGEMELGWEAAASWGPGYIGWPLPGST